MSRGLFSFVLEVKNKTGSLGGSEATFRLHEKKPMPPNNYSNSFVVNSLSLLVTSDSTMDLRTE